MQRLSCVVRKLGTAVGKSSIKGYYTVVSHPTPPRLIDICFRSTSIVSNTSYAGRSFSTSTSGESKETGGTIVSSLTDNNPNTSGGGGNWIEELYQSSVDALRLTGEEQLIDTYPYLKNMVLPFGGTLFTTLLAFASFRRLLKHFYKHSVRGPAATLDGRMPVPYEKSSWGALEDPIRYILTFAAVLHIGGMVAPTITIMADVSSVAVNSIVIMGGTGCFLAVINTLGDFSGGIYARLFARLSVGDTIQVGSFKGQVVQFSPTTTSLLTAGNFHVVIPNSVFSKKAVVYISPVKDGDDEEGAA